MVNGDFVIAPRGRLLFGGSTLADVTQAIQQAFRYWATVVLDLSQVDAIDAAGLGWIARSYPSAIDQGVNFRLLNPTRRVQEALRVMRLASAVPVSYESDEQCLVGCGTGDGLGIVNGPGAP